MGELKDYSGDFRPDVRMHDFSKDTLVRAWVAAAKLYIGIDGLWYSLIKERFGEQMANELEIELWRRGTPLEALRVREAMNIRGDDVAAVFKAFQCDPGVTGVMEVECELKNKDHGILTVKGCRSLEYFERHGDAAMQKIACEVIDMEELEKYAQTFNPKISMTCLKLPPRKNADEIACQWEFKIEE
jgi:hypothetical protein